MLVALACLSTQRIVIATPRTDMHNYMHVSSPFANCIFIAHASAKK